MSRYQKLDLEHDKTFVVSAKCSDLFHVQASGHTKKAAQQKAAYEALLLLKKRTLMSNRKGRNNVFKKV